MTGVSGGYPGPLRHLTHAPDNNKINVRGSVMVPMVIERRKRRGTDEGSTLASSLDLVIVIRSSIYSH